MGWQHVPPHLATQSMQTTQSHPASKSQVRGVSNVFADRTCCPRCVLIGTESRQRQRQPAYAAHTCTSINCRSRSLRCVVDHTPRPRRVLSGGTARAFVWAEECIRAVVICQPAYADGIVRVRVAEPPPRRVTKQVSAARRVLGRLELRQRAEGRGGVLGSRVCLGCIVSQPTGGMVGAGGLNWIELRHSNRV